MLHFGTFLPNVHFGGINAEYFHLRPTTLGLTHKRHRRPKELGSPLGPYYAENVDLAVRNAQLVSPFFEFPN